VLNLAAIHEALAEAFPERECLVFRERRLSFGEVTQRTRRLSDVLHQHGIGRRRGREGLAGHESGQDHVALYLYNGNEYLEGMLGAFKACAAPFNVNYRYVDEELLHLFRDADARAVVYHASFAPTLARIRERLPGVRLWLQVADESGEALLPGALDYEQALAAAEPRAPSGLSADDLYILYTGGTTGLPKGVLWRQQDIFRAGLYTEEVAGLEDVVARARARQGELRVLPAPPFMHGAAHWLAFNMWHMGGSVIVQSQPRRLDPADLWSTVERERVTALSIVGDAFGRPLLDELARRRYDLSSLRLLATGGAILSASLKREFLERLPRLRIRDVLGSSESGAQAVRFSGAGEPATTGDFAPSPGNVVLSEDLSRVLEPGSPEVGWLARAGCGPQGYLGDPEKSARAFPVVAGVRYAVPGDRARHAAGGSLELLGRDSVTINSGGEKVFAEEVEHALKHHPAVFDAVVVGTPHARWGQQVTAVVRRRAGQSVSAEELRETAGRHLAAFKLPRAFVFVDELVRSPSGKPDYRWAREAALAGLDRAGEA
jgi:fatty-acyl-CoA synthase